LTTQYLIIGQGLSGTWLSYYLQKANQSFLVIDEPRASTASKMAAGIINPVTGRRIVTTWMIEKLLPFAISAYQAIGAQCHTSFITPTPIVDFFSTIQMKLAFEERVLADAPYTSLPENQQQWTSYFNYHFGLGVIHPAYTVDVMSLLEAYRQQLVSNHQLKEDGFDAAALVIKPHEIEYKNIIAQKIIFCDGVDGSQLPWFKNLPFAPNKGEALVIEIPNLPQRTIFKKGMLLAPWKGNLFWMGSSYEWAFKDTLPTALFRTKAEQILKEWLQMPYKIVNHMAAVRPATLERRPFVGFHPLYPNIGLLNGMGTKGCSLAPYFAHELVEHLVHHAPLLPAANIKRFERILGR
jgi:glycine/D-amino acid oxidase-like deaminating enzyme